MTNITGRMRSAGLVGFLAVTLLAACVMPVGQWHTMTPAPCADSTYVQLKRQHPDSLSGREWQRLQSLDSACREASSHARPDDRSQSGHEWLEMTRVGVAGGIMSVLMLAMMIRMW